LREKKDLLLDIDARHDPERIMRQWPLQRLAGARSSEKTKLAILGASS
jgi:hypothetical protein